MGAESKDPEDVSFFIAALGSSLDAASCEFANPACKVHAFSGSFDSSSSRQAGTRPSLRMTDVEGHVTWRQQVRTWGRHIPHSDPGRKLVAGDAYGAKGR